MHARASWAEKAEAEYGLSLAETLDTRYEGILVAVGHEAFRHIDVASLKASGNSVVYDLKHLLDASGSDLRL